MYVLIFQVLSKMSRIPHNKINYFPQKGAGGGNQDSVIMKKIRSCVNSDPHSLALMALCSDQYRYHYALKLYTSYKLKYEPHPQPFVEIHIDLGKTFIFVGEGLVPEQENQVEEAEHACATEQARDTPEQAATAANNADEPGDEQHPS